MLFASVYASINYCLDASIKQQILRWFDADYKKQEPRHFRRKKHQNQEKSKAGFAWHKSYQHPFNITRLKFYTSVTEVRVCANRTQGR
jgi:hypothetical protein